MMKLLKSSLLILFLLSITGCGMKKVMYEKEFKEFFKDTDYVVMDVDDKVDSSDVLNAIVAIKSDDSYKIEYYLFKDSSSSRTTYYNNRDYIKENVDGIRKEISGKNYQAFYFTNNEFYKVVERVDNSLIFINADRNYKREIDKLLESMGY